MTDPTWTVDEDGDPVYALPDGSYSSWVQVGDGSHITAHAHAALVQHVRDAHRLHAALAVIRMREVEDCCPDHDREWWLRVGMDFTDWPRVRRITPDEAAVLALAANEGASPERDGYWTVDDEGCVDEWVEGKPRPLDP